MHLAPMSGPDGASREADLTVGRFLMGQGTQSLCSVAEVALRLGAQDQAFSLY